MSVSRQTSDVVKEKLDTTLGRVGCLNEAIDLTYEKQLEPLQQARGSAADVLTGEPVPEPTRFQRILVAVGDGSCADQLVAVAAGLASNRGAQALLVRVSDHKACCGAMDHPALHEHEHALLRWLVESLRARGVHARSELRATANGRVAEHLLDAAAEWRADLLIAAAGRSGRLRGRPWRRVLSRLLDDASCPVLLLPRRQVATKNEGPSSAHGRSFPDVASPDGRDLVSQPHT